MCPGLCGPKAPKHGRIVVLDAEEDVSDVRADNMGKKQKWDGDTSYDLNELPGWHAQRRAAGKLGECEKNMCCKGE
jgi:hypothetical protein